MANTPYTLPISKIISETSDTVTIVLDRPSDDSKAFDYKSGQYLTVEVNINGNPERRAYSLSSSPAESALQFTVKRVEGGKVSNYLNSEVKVGDTLTVFPPEGKFVALPEADKTKDHYFVAAGSGITPVMSMIKTLLEEEERSSLYLLYGSKTEENIIFKAQLDALESKYEGQLTVVHTLSQLKEKKKLFGLLGKKSGGSWNGIKGRIDKDKLQYFFNEYPSRSQESHYYLCGPGNLIQETEKYLIGTGINEKSIHQEYFTAAPVDAKAASTSIGGEGSVHVVLDGEEFTVEVSKDDSILESIINLGKNPPYSCTSGACASCMAKIVSGTVDMDTSFSLDDEEIKNGMILTCQAHPTSSDVKITYDDLG